MTADEIAKYGDWSLKGTRIHTYNRPDGDAMFRHVNCACDRPAYVSRMARVELIGGNQWVLSLEGTDVRAVIVNNDDSATPVFPGFAMALRLTERGYRLDQRETRWDPSGWRPTGIDSWVIPCYHQE